MRKYLKTTFKKSDRKQLIHSRKKGDSDEFLLILRKIYVMMDH